MKKSKWGTFLMLLSLLTGCDQEHTADSKPPITEAAPAEILPGSTNYLDFKNGFRDVKFGQKMRQIDGLVVVQEDKLGTNSTTTCKRTNEVLLLNNVPLKSVTYSFFNDELIMVSMDWDIASTNIMVNSIPQITAITGMMETNLALPWPTGLEGFVETLYGTPTSIDRKKRERERLHGKEIVSRSTSAEWLGSKVRLGFFEWQNADPLVGDVANTSGVIDLSDIQRMESIQRLARINQKIESEKMKDGL